MYLLRRAAVRSFSSQPTAALVSGPRSVAGKTPSTLRAQQWRVSSLQRRFASDEASPAKESETAEQETKDEGPATIGETAQNAAESVKETAASTVESIKESVASATGATEHVYRDAASGLLGDSARKADVGTFGQPKPSKIVYVGNLFFEVQAGELEREFSKYGRVVNCRIATDPKGLSKGFGYVEFEDAQQAAEAIEALDQHVLQGRRMAVQYHVRRQPGGINERRGASNPPSKTLFIGNMSFQMSDKDLNDVFKHIKNVVDVRVAIDRRSGQPRGFAHADFLDVESATAAKEELANKTVFGRQLRIDFSKDYVNRN